MERIIGEKSAAIGDLKVSLRLDADEFNAGMADVEKRLRSAIDLTKELKAELSGLSGAGIDVTSIRRGWSIG